MHKMLERKKRITMAVFDLTEGRVSSQLTRMTIPYFLGVSSMILASMVETIYIGILGAKELAAYSFMFPVIMALTSVSMGIGIGASSLIARAEGAGDRDQVRRITTHTMLLTLALTAALSAGAYLTLEPMFRALGAEGEVLGHVLDFSRVWVLGLVTFTLPMVCSTLLRALGIAKEPGYVMSITSGMQLVISPILIFGLFDMQALGLVGSAWGFISVGVLRIIALGYLVGRENILYFSGILNGVITSSKAIMHIALPSMLSSLIGPVTMAITIALLANHGDVIVAAFGVVSRIEMLVTMILGALASSVAPFVGQNWGARKTERIFEGLLISYRFCLIWGVICLIVLGSFGEPIVRLINDQPELVLAAGWFLVIVPVSFGFLGVGQVAGSVFVALGRPIPPTLLSIFRAIVIYIPLALLFDHHWGYLGIFAAATVSNVIYGAISWWWQRRMLRQAVGSLA